MKEVLVSRTKKTERIVSIDAFRGFIMILMALDHANSFLSFGGSYEFWGGPWPSIESNAAFLTRFITHICAPGFFFLMGISMIYLFHSRKNLNWTDNRIRRYFLIRGFIVIGVHFALSGFLAVPSFIRGQFGIVFNVLFILGIAMIINSFLLRKKPLSLFLLSGLFLLIPVVVLNELIQYSQPLNPIFQLLFAPGDMGPHTVFYTLFPWIGFCTLGIGFGKILANNRRLAFARLPLFSSAAFIFFLILRLLGGFGNIRPPEDSGWMAFLNMTKYPPSLTFSFFTMSIITILLYLFESATAFIEKRAGFLLVFGRSALFFYVIHHIIYVTMMLLGLRDLPMATMYIFWIIGLVVAYPMCRHYASFKRRQPTESFWRMF